MSKSLKTILIFSIAIFGAGFLSVQSTQAIPPLVVQFETTPLFDEANFLPDDAVSRWVKVINNSGQIQRIATEAINKSDPDDFASQLDLTIKEGTTTIFNDTLKEFFDQGETYLSSLANGATTQYDFTIVFNSGAGNEYQEKALGFDILVGFEGAEGGLPLPPPGGGTGGGGSGGGGLPPGLTIVNEGAVEIATTSVTITWNTSYPSTGYVIYSAEGENHTLDLSDNAGSPPKYGYTNATLEYDISPKAVFHSLTISGLTPGMTYYYRAVSHGSLAVSTEHSFTVLTKADEGASQGLVFEGGNEINGEITQGQGVQPEQGGLIGGDETSPVPVVEREIAGQTNEQETNSREFLAAISSFFNGNLWWLLFITIPILAVLFFLSRKKKE